MYLHYTLCRSCQTQGLLEMGHAHVGLATEGLASETMLM